MATMTVYLAFLRAINLGAKRVFPKDDIRRVVLECGFEDVATHINTGNVRLTTSMDDRREVESVLETAFAGDRGFEVPSIVFDAAEFSVIAKDADDLASAHSDLARHYVYLLKDELDADTAQAVEETSGDAGSMVVRGRAVHALLGPGYQAGQVDPLRAAKLLGVTTNRNANVVRTLAAKWCA